jgi:hypothetical protein
MSFDSRFLQVGIYGFIYNTLKMQLYRIEEKLNSSLSNFLDSISHNKQIQFLSSNNRTSKLTWFKQKENELECRSGAPLIPTVAPALVPLSLPFSMCGQTNCSS